MGREEERAAAARGDLVAAGGAGVAAIVVQVARDEHRDAIAEDALLEEGEIALRDVAVELAIALLVDPVRLGGAEDDAIVRRHRVGDLAEVLELRIVDVRLELDVDADEPPAVREPGGEVAARLVGLPAGEAPLAARAEETREGDEAVVPVVISRDREDLG